MSRLCRTLLGAVLLLAATAASANNPFSFGGDVTVSTPVQGDKVAMGGSVTVQAEIGRDLVATGGEVHVESGIGRDLVAAGGEATLAAPVGRDVAMFAPSIEITAEGKVQRNAKLNGKDVNVRGPIGGKLEIRGDDVLIDSEIGGDVVARTERLELGPHARLMGSLRYASNAELVRDPAAEIHGSIEHNAPDERWERWVSSHSSSADNDADERNWNWTWGGEDLMGNARPWLPFRTYSGGMAIVMVLLISGLFPSYAQRLGATVDTQFGGALVLGLTALIGIPILSVVLMVTVIGIPVAIVLLIAYAFLIALSQAAGAVAFGEVALHRLAPERYHEATLRVLFALGAMILVLTVTHTPVLGGLVAFIVLLTGMGAVLKLMRRSSAPPAPAY